MCSFPFSVEKIVEYLISPSVTYILSFTVYLAFPNIPDIPHDFFKGTPHINLTLF